MKVNLARLVKALADATTPPLSLTSRSKVTGRAKSKVRTGFYPSNSERKTRWGAMDFDAHDGNALRARGLAIAAFDTLVRHPQLYVILSTSGSDGWHLFAFTREFHSVDQWTSLFKQVAQLIGAEVVPGICEIFPGEVRPGSSRGIIRRRRADECGRINRRDVLALVLAQNPTCPGPAGGFPAAVAPSPGSSASGVVTFSARLATLP
jgi:hypothetical protein